jgi:hypothetical protein
VLPRFTTDSRGDFSFDLRLDMSSFPAPASTDEAGGSD